jgi:hypothetical protein
MGTLAVNSHPSEGKKGNEENGDWGYRVRSFKRGSLGGGCRERRAGLQKMRNLPFHRQRCEEVGPELNGLDGRKSGSVDGFDYSEANKNAAIVWGEVTFTEYINDPRGKIPGTKMVFPGIKNEQEVKNLWTYVKQFGPNGEKK